MYDVRVECCDHTQRWWWTMGWRSHQRIWEASNSCQHLWIHNWVVVVL